MGNNSRKRIIKSISWIVCASCLVIALLGTFSSFPDSALALKRSSVIDPASSVHLTMGNPSQATASEQNPTNYLMVKHTHALSYNRDRGGPNWVSWQLNSSWMGRVHRTEDWNADLSLPSGWDLISPSSYKGSGYDRGHMIPSDDRTKNTRDNSETFQMTNILPQAPDNNRGAWVELEKYARELVRKGNELYIVAGGVGQKGKIARGKVTVPARTWKVILVLERSGEGVNGVNSNTRTIAVDMPNENGISQDWKQFRTSIDKLESDTGYDFFPAVPSDIQTTIESRIDGEIAFFNSRNIFGVVIFVIITAALVGFGLYKFRHAVLKFLGV
jgi:endonuclease G, mitochondrial